MLAQRLRPESYKLEKEKSVISFSIPLVELHNGTGPLAIFFTTTGKIFAYPIKTKGRYFVKNNSNVKGIYSINHKYRYTWGKTPVYLFAAQESSQIDPIMINELNIYMKKNQLSELRRKDVKHGSHLRLLLKQKKTIGESLETIKNEEALEDVDLKENVEKIRGAIDDRLTDLREKHQKSVNVPDSQKSYILLEHLRKIGEIDDIELADLTNKAESNMLTFESLVDQLKEKHLVTVSEPLDQNVEDFIQDLGAVNAQDLAGFVQDLVINKKGLKDLTPVPLKSIWGPGMLLAVIIGGMIGVVLLAQNFGNITHGFQSGAGNSGIKMPWDLMSGKMILWLQTHIPASISQWFV